MLVKEAGSPEQASGRVELPRLSFVTIVKCWKNLVCVLFRVPAFIAKRKKNNAEGGGGGAEMAVVVGEKKVWFVW